MPITGNAIDQAERTRAELVKRLETLRADRAANEERRAALAFDAETGDAAAKRSIAELTKAAAALDVDVQTVEAAIAEAARRVRAAADASRRQAERDKARQARAILARLAHRFAAIDAGLRQAADNLRAVQSDFRSLGAFGAAVPNGKLIEVNSRSAVYAALAGLGLDVPPIAPAARHSFESLGAGWLASIERWAAGILDAPADKAA